MAYNVKSIKHTYMSLNIKKAINLFLFLTVRNACICTLKVFTDFHVTLWFSCSTALAYFILQFQLLSSGNLAIELNIYIWKEKLRMINATWSDYMARS
jgi:hypothetical protein